MQHYVPEDTSRPLTEAIRPMGWENLGGPLKWSKTVGKSLLAPGDENYPLAGTKLEGSKAFEVQFTGRVGQLARQIHEDGWVKKKFLLLEGVGGTGKSAFELLLTRTLLAPKRKPVTMTFKGETVVPVVEGEPIRINPINSKMGRLEAVEQVIRSEGSMSNRTFSFHESGKLNKSGVDELMRKVTADTSQIRGRVAIITEFDNLTSRQVPSVKASLDTGMGSIPERCLIIADTNNVGKVRNALGEAGFQRVHHISVGRWEKSDLEEAARVYSDAFGIEYSFEGAPERIAKASAGAIRNLVKIFEELKGASPLSEEEFERLAGNVQTTGGQFILRQLDRNISKIRKGGHPGLVASNLCNSLSRRNVSARRVLQDLGHRLFEEKRVSQQASNGLAEAMPILRQQNRRFEKAQWAALVTPLAKVLSGFK